MLWWPWIVTCFALVWGALWGSFFDLVISRWPMGLSVVRPRSFCPSCGSPIPAWHNIPLLSFILLRARASCCGARLDARMFISELVFALVALALAWHAGLLSMDPLQISWSALLEALLYFFWLGGLWMVAWIDWQCFQIPDAITIPLTAVGLVTASWREEPGLASAALGAGLGALIVYVPFVWLYSLLFNRRGMGEGDAKLLMAVGVFLGWQAVPMCLLAASVLGLALFIVLGRTRYSFATQREGKTAIAFGPLLVIAAVSLRIAYWVDPAWRIIPIFSLAF